MLTDDGEGTKKVPLPVALHLKQAVGALTLHTGRNLYNYQPIGIKNANSKVGELSSPVSNVVHYKDEIFF